MKRFIYIFSTAWIALQFYKKKAWMCSSWIKLCGPWSLVKLLSRLQANTLLIMATWIFHLILQPFLRITCHTCGRWVQNSAYLDVSEHGVQVVRAGAERQVVQDIRGHLPDVWVQCDDAGLLIPEEQNSQFLRQRCRSGKNLLNTYGWM